MRIGQIFAIVGALFVFIGVGVLNPVFMSLFDGNVVPMYELELLEKFIYGYEIPALQVLLLFAGLAALAAVAAFFVRVKKRLAITNLIFAVAIIAVMAYAHASAREVITEAMSTGDKPMELFKGEVVHALEGPLFCYFGGILIMMGSLIVFASRRVFRPTDRFLRVAALWNGAIERDEVFFEPANVKVGETKTSRFVLPTATVGGLPDEFTLFRKDSRGRYELGLLPGMVGDLKLQSERSSIADYLAKHGGGAAQWVPIESGDWGVVNIGEASLFFQFVPPERGIQRKGAAAFPWDMAGSTAFSAAVQIGFILFALFAWQEEAIRNKGRDIRKMLKVEVESKLEMMEEELLDTAEEEDDTGKKAEGDEGKFGDPDDDPEIESKVPKRDGEMVDKIDPKKVGLNDLLSSSALGGKSAISDILSRDTSGFSNKLAIAMSGTGSEFVMGHGSGGLGFQGTGTGGGGTGGYGRIHGLGKIDTGGGVGVRASMGRKRAARVGKLKFGDGASQGFCSRGDISKNVRMRAGAIRACYEQQLQVKPALAGKVTIRWTIHLDGSVTGAAVAESSLNDGNVENCILRAIRRIRFQKPEGGICIVKWPFVFNPG